MYSSAEENYLKAIFKLQEASDEMVATSALAQVLGIHMASVTDMLKKMSNKKLITYQKSKGFKLTDKGRLSAIGIIRKHRLWEVFLVDKLGFKWHQVHEIAEQLEHIHSQELIDKLDAYLDFPKTDPHGDPIPDAKGVFVVSKSVLLASLPPGSQGRFTGVTDHSSAFLNYLDRIGLSLGDPVKVKEVEAYDKNYTLQLKAKRTVVVSLKVANSLLISE
ncbi:metal-dependent transcriptional regulator [Niastella populi]|uniref:Transcriptional regulator MntR n=1 Tax=Niastella populi TaxID=550983 RepID=A0A1V9G6A4_9BACT|nr:metal-dependent transcriptional regulator [Niastella populi]OQP66117.1 iron-dependent repressor [Niastella populi]